MLKIADFQASVGHGTLDLSLENLLWMSHRHAQHVFVLIFSYSDYLFCCSKYLGGLQFSGEKKPSQPSPKEPEQLNFNTTNDHLWVGHSDIHKSLLPALRRHLGGSMDVWGQPALHSELQVGRATQRTVRKKKRKTKKQNSEHFIIKTQIKKETFMVTCKG